MKILLEILEDVLASRRPDGHIRLPSLPVTAIRTVQTIVVVKSEADTPAHFYSNGVTL
jgi:hypothetical protein